MPLAAPPTNSAHATALNRLNSYLEATRRRFEACFSTVSRRFAIDGMTSELRLHYLQFDGTGRPKFEALARALATQITYYCLSSRRRIEAITEDARNELFIEARDYFRHSETAGEPGELLLYFLIEAVIGAPQMVCKMELKTNREDELKGSDGIHMWYDHNADCLHVYFGEAKLHESYTGALAKTVRSLSNFHSGGQERAELRLVSKFFKWADQDTQKAVTDYIDDQVPVGNCKIRHACLVGFDWPAYGILNTPERARLIQSFEAEYANFFEKSILPRLNKHFSKFSHRYLEMDFFFLPFKSVQEFRDEFHRVLFGA